MSCPRSRAAAVASLAVLLLTAGCDTGDGRALAEPEPGATAPPLATSTSTTTPPTLPPTAVSTPDGPVITPTQIAVLTSPAFAAQTAIPARFSCDGGDVSPPLSWTSVPAEAVELALVVHDPDAPNGDFLHWLVAGIDPAVTGIAEGGLPEAAVEVSPWIGPCPPRGETHTYVFELRVLLQASEIVPETDVVGARNALDVLTSQTATFTATYGRPA